MDGINAVVICLAAPFRGGSVGAAEGEKIIRAAERAQRKQLPLIFYAHGTAGIRIQEGTNGVLQMPRCTMALRKYVDAGGLYLVSTIPILTVGQWQVFWAAPPISSGYVLRRSVLPDQGLSPKLRAFLFHLITTMPGMHLPEDIFKESGIDAKWAAISVRLL